MLKDTDLNPSVRVTSRLAKVQAPHNRAAYLGNDITGKSHIDMSSTTARTPRARTTWDTTSALLSYVNNKYNR
jgi:hypothetical protein